MPDSVPLDEKKATSWPFNCSVSRAPYDGVNRSSMYKTSNNLLYPINVGRNIARRASNTYFIMASDVELYPSLNFVEQFLQMINDNISLISTDRQPR